MLFLVDIKMIIQLIWFCLCIIFQLDKMVHNFNVGHDMKIRIYLSVLASLNWWWWFLLWLCIYFIGYLNIEGLFYFCRSSKGLLRQRSWNYKTAVYQKAFTCLSADCLLLKMQRTTRVLFWNIPSEDQSNDQLFLFTVLMEMLFPLFSVL